MYQKLSHKLLLLVFGFGKALVNAKINLKGLRKTIEMSSGYFSAIVCAFAFICSAVFLGNDEEKLDFHN